MDKQKRQASASISADTSTSASSRPLSLPRSSNIITLDYGFSDGQLVYSLPITLHAHPSPQKLKVLPDTASADLWFVDSSCKTDSCSSTASVEPVIKYDPQKAGAKNLVSLSHALCLHAPSSKSC